jgi:predicted nucleotidyltransferase
VRGAVLTGSWAGGYATGGSDVDLLALCNENRFEASRQQGVLVETIYTTYGRALEKLAKSPMEAYRWLEAKIMFDNDGGLAELIQAARKAYESYRTPEGEKRRLAHWLRSLELKLAAAGQAGDALKERYLTVTNAWILLEAVWAANDRPMPPAATAVQRYPRLDCTPFPGWFEALFHEEDAKRLKATRQTIEWALERLEK